MYLNDNLMKNLSNFKTTVVSSSLIFISFFFIGSCIDGNHELEKSGNVGNSTSVNASKKSDGISTLSEQNVELYESSISCGEISTIQIIRDADGVVRYRRGTYKKEQTGISSTMFYPNDFIPERQKNGEVTFTIPKGEDRLWFIPFNPSGAATEIQHQGGPIVVTLKYCYCKEQPEGYMGSAYCKMEIKLNSNKPNETSCVHQACCNCELKSNGSGGGYPISSAGVLFRATTITEYK